MKRFHSGTAAGVAMLTIITSAAHAQPRVRMNIKDQTPAQHQQFVDAMFALRRMAPAGGAQPDPTLPQNRYEQLIRAHDRNSNIAHDNSVFLPWHRQFLFQMENDVRGLGVQMVPDATVPGGQRRQDFSGFTLPYWDGTRDAFPASVVGGDGLGANGAVNSGPFRAGGGDFGTWQTYQLTGNGLPMGDPNRVPFAATRRELRRDFGADADSDGRFDVLVTNGPGTLTAALAMDGVTAGQRYTNFRSALEGGAGLHNAHHSNIGGDVGDPVTGTTDPAFWLLHAFTDLQWARWECAVGALYQGAGGVDAAMTGAPDAGGAVFGLTELNGGTDVTPANVLNFLTMPGGGYTYDARLSYANEDRTILGQGGNVCAVPAPGAFALLGLGGLLAARRRRMT